MDIYHYREPIDGKKIKYKGRELYVLKEIPEDAVVLGTTALNKLKNEDNDETTLALGYGIYPIKKLQKIQIAPRWIETYEGAYVHLRRRIFIPLLIFMIALGGTLVASSHIDLADKYSVTEDGSAWDGNLTENTEKIAQESISLIIPDDLRVSRKKPYIKLINPPENDVYLKFSVYEGDNLLAETGDVLPGNSVEDIELFSKLSKGQHDLVVRVSSHDVETLEETQGANIKTIITVE